jgi:DNA-binding HxlR family transcriptional regulator
MHRTSPQPGQAQGRSPIPDPMTRRQHLDPGTAPVDSPVPTGWHDPVTRTPDWPAAQAAIAILAGKWVLPVLAALAAEPQTYGDLHRTIGPAISPKVLTETLHRMRRTQLITRDPPPAAPASLAPPGPLARPIRYRLTDSARQLLPALAGLAAWHIARRPAQERPPPDVTRPGDSLLTSAPSRDSTAGVVVLGDSNAYSQGGLFR